MNPRRRRPDLIDRLEAENDAIHRRDRWLVPIIIAVVVTISAVTIARIVWSMF